MLQGLVTLKREELYQKVWSISMVSLAGELKIPWRKLKNICKMMDIPTPYTAYWCKRLTHKDLMPTPLPLPTSDTLFEYSYYPMPDENYNPDPENLPIIQISKHTKFYHPLIKNALTSRSNGSTNKNLRILNLNFSENNLTRSLLLLDTIFKEVEKRGCQIDIFQDVCRNVLKVVKGDLSMPITLFETQTPNYSMTKDVEYQYTGLLTCTINYEVRKITKVFEENNKNKLEDYLPEIINSIILGFEIKRQFKAYVLNNKNLRERISSLE
jgi:hypothetical protein